MKFALMILIIFPNFSNSRFKIDPIFKTLRDETNRPIILHGVNIVVKRPPYLPDTEKFDSMNSLTIEDVKIMKTLGFNFVRLGVMWEAVEKTEKFYDIEYLKQTQKIINLLGENGIYTLIDIHQDLFSRVFCGEGVPVFYSKNLPYKKKCNESILSYFLNLVGMCTSVDTFGWKYDDNGLPEIESCRNDFVRTSQSSIEIGSSYGLFYDNVNNIRNNYFDFMEVIAAFFKGNEYILGMDPWNEPLPKGILSDFQNFLPSFADDKYLTPLYRDLYNRLRKIDKDLIYLFEPFPVPDTIPLFGGIFLPSFSESPLGSENTDKQIFNVHSYCILAGVKYDEKTNEPKLEDAKTTCPKFHSGKIKQNKHEGLKNGMQTIITEFGACSDSEACYYEMKGLLDAADENAVGWAYWMYKPYADHTTSANWELEGLFYKDGTLQKIKEKALSRTYIQKYPGIPSKSSFNDSDGHFIGQFIYKAEINQPILLYLNKKLNYPNFETDYIIKLIDEENRNLPFAIKKENKNDYDENYLEISISKEITNLDGKLISLEIAKK
jgi:endoglycosylceramidase